MILAAISWYSAGPIITLNCGITVSDYVDILGNEVHSTVQYFLLKHCSFQHDYSPTPTHSQKRSVLV